MKSNEEDLSSMIVDENSMNFQSKIQKFLNLKTIIKPPIQKREFLDNMNILYENGKTFVDGNDVSGLIRTNEISK